MTRYYVKMRIDFDGHVEAKSPEQAEELAWTSWGDDKDITYNGVYSIDVEEDEVGPNAGTTEFNIKCEILAEIWLNYREDERFKELVEFADIGFPLAHMLQNDIVDEPTGSAEGYIQDTWHLLLKQLKIEDTGFQSITHLLQMAAKNNNPE